MAFLSLFNEIMQRKVEVIGQKTEPYEMDKTRRAGKSE